jgi:putative tryptophan/tyrosine transport system substrate-binding protein
MFGIRRRDFITLLGGAAAAWPLAARAQQSTMPVIGFLNIGSSRAFSAFLAAFHQGLNSAGYIEGRNVAFEYRWADGDFALLREQANDLVRRNVTLIVATGGLVVARVAKDATNTIPLIFIGGGYPVEEGLVTSVNRPGGNASGVNLLEPIREVLESDESDVIHCWALDSLESARCGSLNTALRRTAVAFVTRAI